MYIYHWYLILLTLLIVQNVYSRPPQGLNNLNLFHCVCLLLIWQYRNVYSIRHCSSFFFFGRENFSESPETRPCSLETSEANRANTQRGNSLFEVVLDLLRDMSIFSILTRMKKLEKIGCPRRGLHGMRQRQTNLAFANFISSHIVLTKSTTPTNKLFLITNSYQLNSFFVLASGGAAYLSWNRRGIKIWMRLHREMLTYLCSSSICEILHQVT